MPGLHSIMNINRCTVVLYCKQCTIKRYRYHTGIKVPPYSYIDCAEERKANGSEGFKNKKVHVRFKKIC